MSTHELPSTWCRDELEDDNYAPPEQWSRPWGDAIPRRSENSFRIAFQNIRGLPTSHLHPKSLALNTFLQSHDFDIFGIAETNLYWPLVPAADRFPNRLRGVFEHCKASIAFNSRLPWSGTRQFGGTALITLDQATARCVSVIGDERRLGRWVGCRFRGREESHLWVVSAYRPCQTHNPLGAYLQQQTALHLSEVETDPRSQFFIDLKALITPWIHAGDQVLVLLDSNEDVRSGQTRACFEELGMEELLLRRHSTLPAVATVITNSQAVPIDGIFGTSGLIPRGGGYFPGDEGVMGADHRCLWIEFQLSHIFRHSLPPVVRPPVRRLKSGDPRLRDKFMNLLDESIPSEFDQAVRTLYTSVRFPAQNDCISVYDSFEEYFNGACKQAERKCRKLCMGAIPYSPDLAVAIHAIVTWQRVLRLLRGGRRNIRSLLRLARRASVIIPIDITEDAASSALSSAFLHFRELKHNDPRQRRINFIEGLAAAKAVDTSKDYHLVYRQLLDRERIRNVNRKFTSLFNSTRSSLDYIIGPDRTGQIVSASTKNTMEAVAEVENSARFSQTHFTPFLTLPLVNQLGYLADGPDIPSVLLGSFEPSGDIDDATSLLIKKLETPACIAHIDRCTPWTDFGVFRRGWHNAKETTSVHPDGLHQGHFKSLHLHSERFHLLSSMLSAIPMKGGFGSIGFRQGINVMIEKKPGVREAKSLRTILLLDGRFNMNNKILAQHMMKFAEQHELLAPEQYGSRPRKSAILQSMNKRFFFDLALQLGVPTIVICNDAKSAYDRVVHSVAMLACQRLGLPPEATRSMFHPISSLLHRIRTPFGDSSTPFQSSSHVPFQGVGQGNGAGPAIWAAISSVVFDVLRESGFSSSFTSPQGTTSTPICGLAFVDDTDLIITAQPQESPVELIQRAQRGLDFYEGLIHATGGAIEPSKSYVYFLFPTTDNIKRSFRTLTELRDMGLTTTLSCLDSSRRRVNLPSLEPSMAQRTLGVMMSPCGQTTSSTEHMRSISASWADQLRTSHLSKQETWYALSTRFFRRLHYPLLPLTLTNSQCTKIMSPILGTALPAIGVARTAPRALVYGPRTLQGLAFPNLFTTSLVTHCSMIISQSLSKSLTGQLLRIAMETALWESGCAGPLFQISVDISPLLSYGWIRHVWMTCYHSGIRIKDDIMTSPLLRIGDFYLMEALLRSGQFSKASLTNINACRLFLQVLSAADVVSGDGEHLQSWVLRGQIHLRPLRRPQWPTRSRPSAVAWRCWRHALRVLFPVHPTTHTLVNPLGSWIVDPPQWTWFFHPETSRFVREESEGRWLSYPVTGPGRRVGIGRPVSHFSIQMESRPPNSFPTSVGSGHASIIAGYRNRATPPASPQPISVWDAISRLPQSGQWVFSSFMCNDQGAAIVQALRSGQLIAVSDGSFSPSHSRGSSAWVICPLGAGDNMFTGVNLVPLSQSDSSFRSELAGIYSILLALQVISDVHCLTSAEQLECTIFCDGQSALSRVQSFTTQDSSFSISSDHFDFLSAISTIRARLPISCRFRHVLGHQDSQSPFSSLPLEAQLNVQMDQLAKAYLHHSLHSNTQPSSGDIYGECWSCWTNSGKVVVKFAESLSHSIDGSNIMTYWQQRRRFTDQQRMAIDWELMAQSMQGVSYDRSIWISKHVSGWAGVGQFLHRWDSAASSSCPFCGTEEETTHHVITCSDPRVRQRWEQVVLHLVEWMSTRQFHPELATAIQRALLSWGRGLPVDTGLLSSEILSAIQSQSWLGWESFVDGVWSTSWRSIQSRFFVTIGSRRSSLRHLTALQQKVYDTAFDMWQHRNAAIHDRGELVLQRATLALDDAIREEWARGNPSQDSRIRRLLNPNIDTILSYSALAKRHWLLAIRARRTILRQHLDDSTVSMQHLLSRYLGRHQ